MNYDVVEANYVRDFELANSLTRQFVNSLTR